jgi:hypothetical protein
VSCGCSGRSSTACACGEASADQRTQRIDRRDIGKLQVVECELQPAAAAMAGVDERAYSAVQARQLTRRTDRLRRRPERRHEPRNLAFGFIVKGRVKRLDEHVAQAPQRAPGLQCVGRTRAEVKRSSRRFGEQLLDQARLADARFASDDEHVARGERAAAGGQRVGAADHSRRAQQRERDGLCAALASRAGRRAQALRERLGFAARRHAIDPPQHLAALAVRSERRGSVPTQVVQLDQQPKCVLGLRLEREQ